MNLGPPDLVAHPSGRGAGSGSPAPPLLRRKPVRRAFGMHLRSSLKLSPFKLLVTYPASKNLYFKPSASGRSKRRMAF